MDVATLNIGVSVVQVSVFDNRFVVNEIYSNAFDRDNISMFICTTVGMQNALVILELHVIA